MRQMKRASLCVAVGGGVLLAAAGSLKPAMGQAATPSLNYEFFKAKVEPVFLAKRAGHTRCVVCHTINNAPLHLVPLSPGSATWNEEQRAGISSWCRKWWCPATMGASCSPIRSLNLPAAIPITAEASNLPRRTTRSGRR